MAVGKSCNIDGKPLNAAMGTASCGPNIKLKTNTIIIDAPKPTNPLMNPAKNIPPPMESISSLVNPGSI